MRLNFSICILFFFALIIEKSISVDQFCAIDECVIETDFGPASCTKTNEYYDFDQDGFPKCVTTAGEGDKCSQLPCPPGFFCDDDDDGDFECHVKDDACIRFDLMPVDEKPKWIPKCLIDGTYAPKQCKGEQQNGRCFCFDAIGKRIFGEEWSRDAGNMTCACSRRRAELERNRQDVTLHCDSMGNYEPLQCDSGSCWCADPQTGEVLESVVPETMMTILSCYHHDDIGDQYLRQCESQLIAQAKIREELFLHGTSHANLPFVKCDWDGSYGSYKVNKGNVYCTWKDHTNLGSWQQNADGNLDELNCNCARDSKIYEMAGITMTKQCNGNGNYKEIQKIEDEYFCVDDDGFATMEPVSIMPDVCKQF